MALPTKIEHDQLLSNVHDISYVLLSNTASNRAAPVTICHVMLKNGKNVIGINYGAIDPENHSEEMGREYAYKEAIDKLYELEGYALICKHHEQQTELLVDKDD